MGKLVYSKDLPFDLKDFAHERICRVYAGNSCVMALTEDGRVLQKVADKNVGARTEYWRNIADIAVSQWYPGAAIGLVSDGTCMISKRPMRAYCDDRHESFERINDAVKAWRNIVEVAVSDAYFALDANGKVHYTAFDSKNDDYKAVLSWDNVAHISVGSQCSVFGVTRDGHILCTGHNCENGPRGNLQRKLADITDAVDVCALGSECEALLIAHRDGTLTSIGMEVSEMRHAADGAIMRGCFLTAAVRCADGCLTIVEYDHLGEDIMRGIDNAKVKSFAVGHNNCIDPFVIAVV